MNLQLIILLLASRLSLNAGLNDLEKQVASLRIKLDKLDVELKQLKSITEIQNKKINLLNESNEDLQQQLQNQSAMIDDLKNHQEQLQNSTNQNLLQGDEAVTELYGSGFQQEIYQLLNLSNDRTEYLMDQEKELRKNYIIIQKEIKEIDTKFLNITDGQFDHITNLIKQTEKLQNVIQSDANKNNILFSTFNESINEQRYEIAKISNFIDNVGSKYSV